LLAARANPAGKEEAASVKELYSKANEKMRARVETTVFPLRKSHRPLSK